MEHFFIDKNNYKAAYPEIRRFVDEEMVLVHVPYYSEKMKIDGDYLSCYVDSWARLDWLYEGLFGKDFREEIEAASGDRTRFVDLDGVSLVFGENEIN